MIGMVQLSHEQSGCFMSNSRHHNLAVVCWIALSIIATLGAFKLISGALFGGLLLGFGSGMLLAYSLSDLRNDRWRFMLAILAPLAAMGGGAGILTGLLSIEKVAYGIIGLSIAAAPRYVSRIF